jgi:hypothetical protein
MKYLTSFNEGFIKKDELRDFCEMYLAYLLDDSGWDLYLDRRYITLTDADSSSVSGYSISLARPKQAILTQFKWGEVKNHILTFVDMLNRNYDMKGISRVVRIDTDGKVAGIPFPKGTSLDSDGELHFNNVESFLNLESRVFDNITLYNIRITIKE